MDAVVLIELLKLAPLLLDGGAELADAAPAVDTAPVGDFYS